MNRTLVELKAWGCDIDGAMERFLDDEDLYMACLDSVINDENFLKLGQALNENTVEAAFDCAHTLKGVVANMGLTPLYDAIVRIVEPLRSRQTNDLTSDYTRLLVMKKQLNKIVKRDIECM